MKLQIALCLVLCTGYAFCVSCTTNQDCVADNSHGCSGLGWFEICQHPNPAGGITIDGGLCTCGLSTACRFLADCQAYSCSHNLNIHCYDGHCVCNRF